jgi:Family of unknown function (DUF5690)
MMIIKRWLRHETIFTIWASVAAFSAYFCMYAFRKPFTAGTYAGLQYWGMDYKIWLVIAQVLGYMLSKFIGIKIISEMSPKNRPLSMVLLIGFSWLALLFLPVVPMPYHIICLFFNGLPLGLIWGIVFSFLEGRRMTELLGAGLAVSFIVSSGVVKTVGKTLIQNYGFSEFQMPFMVGAIFFMPLILSVWMLSQLPPPSVKDQILRSERQPMTANDRRILFKRHWFGIVCLTAFYFILTAFRDFRDNFIVEIWQSLGYADNASILTTAEIPIALTVLILVASLVLVKNNAVAFWLNHALILIGGITVAISTYLFENNIISPVSWMILVGFGLYLSYILFQSLIFERMMATFREVGNVGFLMYMADAFGYLGSIIVMFYKNFGVKDMSWLQFFTHSAYVVAWSCGILVSLSLLYFFQKYEYKKIGLQSTQFYLSEP